MVPDVDIGGEQFWVITPGEGSFAFRHYGASVVGPPFWGQNGRSKFHNGGVGRAFFSFGAGGCVGSALVRWTVTWFWIGSHDEYERFFG